jgi:hypothetical protein
MGRLFSNFKCEIAFLGWKGMERKIVISDNALLIFYVWIFHISTYSSQFGFASKTFPLHSISSGYVPSYSHVLLLILSFSPVLYDCVRVWVSEFTFFVLSTSRYINELCSSFDRVSMRCSGWR